MSSTAQPLPDAPAELRAIIAQLTEQLAEAERERGAQEQRIAQLLETIELLKRKRFGRSADQVPDSQLRLFDATELEALIGELEAELPAPAAPDTAKDKETPTKRQPVRRPLPSHLPRVERLLDLGEDEKAAMGEDWSFIGYDTSEQLAILPRQTYVIVYKRAKYVARTQDVPGAEVGVKIAPRPEQIIPKSIAHASLLAGIVTAKFVDALPLYRQEKIFEREGIDLSRQTMAGLLIQLNAPLTPIAAALKALLRQGAVVHVDETPVQVLREPGRDNTQTSYMWVFCGGPPGQPVRWFAYADSRAACVPKGVLLETPAQAGGTDPPPAFYLQSDGYSAYGVVANAPEVIGHAGCWTHVRRKFVDAASGRNSAAAQQMLAYIGQLYAVEKRLRAATPAERHTARLQQSRPILDAIKTWLEATVTRTPPKGLLGKAVHYALGQWPILTTFLEDGRLAIDNNSAENAIRPFVIGRKNWLFAGSPKGAETSALLYSLIETAKANALEPWAYLNHLFEYLPSAKTPEAIAALLPHNLTMDDIKPLGSIL
ncbi:IS66 family transposase [Thiorhodococcus drewsii]|nr:IS66 family transposase [Thiorhodococcus drewsii]